MANDGSLHGRFVGVAAMVVFDGRVVDHQWHHGGVPGGVGRLLVCFMDEAGKPFLSRDNVSGAPGIMPFLEATLSFLDGRLLLGSSGLCFVLCRVRVLLPFLSLWGKKKKKKKRE
jgi:hypothetical protein